MCFNSMFVKIWYSRCVSIQCSLCFRKYSFINNVHNVLCSFLCQTFRLCVNVIFQVRQEFINVSFVKSSFLKFDIQIKFFFSCHHVHVKATLNDDRKYYKKRIVDFLRKFFLWLMLKIMRSSMIKCSRCVSIQRSSNMMFAMCLDTMFVVFSKMFFYW